MPILVLTNPVRHSHCMQPRILTEAYHQQARSMSSLIRAVDKRFITMYAFNEYKGGDLCLEWPWTTTHE